MNLHITPIPGYEEYYGATECGKIFSFNYRRTGRTFELAQNSLFKREQKNKTMYKRVKVSHINKNSPMQVHRLIALTFIPNPNNYPQVNHIDGDKGNNHKSNLEWCSNSQNQIHAFESGLRTYAKGHDHHQSKLTENDVIEIKRRLKGMYKGLQKDLAVEFGVSNHAICDIHRGKTWRHIK